jgi:SagB-type dehydrogenase family enzyme
LIFDKPQFKAHLHAEVIPPETVYLLSEKDHFALSGRLYVVLAPALDKPDLEQLMKHDMPLTAVVERRRSIRAYAEKPITAAELGHFLYRTVRLKHLILSDKQELYSRPYPSGGAIYELEFYMVVRECDGLGPGLYHYDPQGHLLCKPTESTPQTDALLQGAWWSNGGQCVPQVLIVMSARFARMMWKYQAMAYAAILKHVGVVYQTMYLVAKAMGLAPWAWVAVIPTCSPRRRISTTTRKPRWVSSCWGVGGNRKEGHLGPASRELRSQEGRAALVDRCSQLDDGADRHQGISLPLHRSLPIGFKSISCRFTVVTAVVTS